MTGPSVVEFPRSRKLGEPRFGAAVEFTLGQDQRTSAVKGFDAGRANGLEGHGDAGDDQDGNPLKSGGMECAPPFGRGLPPEFDGAKHDSRNCRLPWTERARP